MRKGPGQALQLRVAPGAVQLARISRWRAPASTPLGEQRFSPDSSLHGDFPAIGKALAQLLAAQDWRGWPVTVMLDDALSRLWPVALPQGAASLADIEAAAALRFQSLYGDAPELWRSSRSWTARAPLFCAVPRALLAQLARVAEDAGLATVSIVPQFVDNWNRWQRSIEADAWFGQLHGTILTLGVLHDGVLSAVRAIAVPEDAQQPWLAQTVAREALLHGVPAPGLLQLCGVPPSCWLAPRAAGRLACSALGPGGEGA